MIWSQWYESRLDFKFHIRSPKWKMFIFKSLGIMWVSQIRLGKIADRFALIQSFYFISFLESKRNDRKKEQFSI